MSEDRKNWYEGLTASELEGKHVHVVYDYGEVVDGELLRDGQVRLDLWASGGAPVFLIDDGCVVGTCVHIRSVSLMWDEHDWEQIRTEDANRADAIVVNDRLLQVDKFINDLFMVKYYSPIPLSFVSCVLRRKPKLPTKQGHYQDEDGNTWLLKAGKWYVLIGPYYMSPVSPKEVALPLTPMSSVDESIDYE